MIRLGSRWSLAWKLPHRIECEVTALEQDRVVVHATPTASRFCARFARSTTSRFRSRDNVKALFTAMCLTRYGHGCKIRSQGENKMPIQTTSELQARYDTLTPAEKATPQARLAAAMFPAMRMLDAAAQAAECRYCQQPLRFGKTICADCAQHECESTF